MQGGGIRHHTRHLGVAHVQRNVQGSIEGRQRRGQIGGTQSDAQRGPGCTGDGIHTGGLQITQIQGIRGGRGQRDRVGCAQGDARGLQGGQVGDG